MNLQSALNVVEWGWGLTGAFLGIGHFAQAVDLIPGSGSGPTVTVTLIGTSLTLIGLKVLEVYGGIRKINAESDHGKLVNCQEAMDQMRGEFDAFRAYSGDRFRAMEDEVRHLRATNESQRVTIEVQSAALGRSIPAESVTVTPKAEP